MIIAFWICFSIVFYTFIGYGIVLYLLVQVKRLFAKKSVSPININNLPTVTVVVAAYNEELIIEEKIKNTLSLQYPSGKINYIFVTDGSTDATASIVSRYHQIRLMHSPDRKGKVAAIHRVMPEIKSEIVVFTDANTFVNENALLEICAHYTNTSVGCVSGEKRVYIDEQSDATAGEGFYWKYESKLKSWDAELYSVAGAAGELFSIRTALYEAVPLDTILDDFMISLSVVKKGYRIMYEPEAYAMETSSESTTEELKRKIRISAGGIQSILRLKYFFNPFINPVFTFQYISHRVLRWTITPFLMLLTFLLNGVIVLQHFSGFYCLIFAAQLLFYSLAIIGWLLERKQLRIKAVFIPYYFCLMNYAVIAGIFRYMRKQQSAAWDKAKRK
jgi:cellulose synthase/poly-beta-1,6-N-acetylglucosamine synthase-like glycosyltransferase